MITRLEWDSTFFGFDIGEVAAAALAPERLASEAMAGGYRCVYYRCSAGDAEALARAARAGLTLVDVRVTLEVALDLDPSRRRMEPDPAIAVAAFGEADRLALERVARQLSRYSRFAFDPGFGASQAERLYAEWLRASCAGRADAILVAKIGGEPVGFVTCRRSGQRAQLELVAVEDACAGRGVGTALLSEAHVWLEARGVHLVRVATQGRNHAAINFYVRCGYQLSEVDLVFHRWF